MLLHVGLKAKKHYFPSLASKFAQISSEAIHAMTECVSNGDKITANSFEERQVLELMKQVNAVSSFVPSSSASKAVQRSELKALMINQGLPSFYVTINPSDVHNPLVRFLAGSDIDIDSVLPGEYDSFSQSMLVSKNPFTTAKFFNLYMQAFIQAILVYTPDLQKQKHEDGILGKVKAYYGCVEAQGRGTLHCHMLIWIKGSLNLDEIKKCILNNDEAFKQRIIQFLDDMISNHMPDDVQIPNQQPYHLCTIQRPPIPVAAADPDSYVRKDHHLLVQQCQYHHHSATCYKYDIHSCHFDMHEGNYKPISCFDPTLGELTLRCLHGLVNNFNETILDCIRCNMDIKFIGSGASAKAILYYITNYITKSQLKTHVAYAALELAMFKLGEYDPVDNDITFRAKWMLQRCTYAMISHQELSAPQVVSYLMDYDEHFTSHKFVRFNWLSIERYVNNLSPLDPVAIAPEDNRSAPTDSIFDSQQTDSEFVADSELVEPPDEPPAYSSDVDNSMDIDMDAAHTIEDAAPNDSNPMSPDSILVQDDCVDDEEVVLHVDEADNLIACTSLLQDYLH